MCCACAGHQKLAAGQLQSEHLQQELVQLLARRQQPSAQQDVQQPWQFTQQYHFDPLDCGSYPCKQQLQTAMWRDLAACHQAVAQALAAQQADNTGPAAAGSTNPLQNPFGWVPDDLSTAAADADSSDGTDTSAAERISSIRPRTAQIRSRTATTLQLEFFDSPEMEQVDIQQKLQDAAAAGGQGLQALSRFYSPDGAFSWKPCTVLQFDRCAPLTTTATTLCHAGTG